MLTNMTVRELQTIDMWDSSISTMRVLDKYQGCEIAGIYQIFNYGLNRAYIGQSKHVILRVAQHKGLLERKKHGNYYLQVDHYNDHKMDCKIVELLIDETNGHTPHWIKKFLEWREADWFEKLADRYTLYNLLPKEYFYFDPELERFVIETFDEEKAKLDTLYGSS